MSELRGVWRLVGFECVNVGLDEDRREGTMGPKIDF